MAKQIVSKAVAFNILDPDQQQLFEHAMQRSNFSAYVKRLIQRDLEGGASLVTTVKDQVKTDRAVAQGFI